MGLALGRPVFPGYYVPAAVRAARAERENLSMAKQFPRMEPKHQDFIRHQHVFFVASAAAGSHVNLSPKDGASLRVLGESEVVYLDRTGSGNETSAHLRADGRLTFMFCAFDGLPQILRLYGRGRVLPRGGPDYERLLTAEFTGWQPPGARQMVALDVELVLTSCGYQVPLYDYRAERPNLERWAEKQGREGLRKYRRDHNEFSIDGLPTGFVEGDLEAAGR